VFPRIRDSVSGHPLSGTSMVLPPFLAFFLDHRTIPRMIQRILPVLKEPGQLF